MDILSGNGFQVIPDIRKEGDIIAKKKKNTVTKTVPVTYPHFRNYKKSGHPALITAERSKDEYNYRKVMHKERDGRHLNEKVFPNPDPSDPKPMYIGKRVRHDRKDNFSTWQYSWKYPKK